MSHGVEEVAATRRTAPEPVNIGRWLEQAAERDPEGLAVVRALGRGQWERVTFSELHQRARRVGAGLRAQGIGRGTRACVFVHPSADLIAITFALLGIGAVPVLADPGMGRTQLLACIAKARPEVLFGIPRALLAKRLFPASFRSVKLTVAVDMPLPWFGLSLERLMATGTPGALEDTREDDDAAILFTSGSTGPPKGVRYTHGMFEAQRRALGDLYDFRPGEVDLACFPLFGLFDAGFGMTSVFPEIDPSHPARCEPEKIVEAIETHGATTTFGSPAIWRRVVPWCVDHARKLPTLRQVLIAGAPVPPDLIREFHKVLELEADVFTPYGATEALPVASVAGRDVGPALLEFVLNGAGTCVGKTVPGLDVRLIEITDDAIETWSDELVVPRGRPGEICVRGAQVTHEYDAEQQHTARAKIHADDGVWHRMGDVGRFDDEGRLWYLGRKSHRLMTEAGLRMPVPAENVFNTHPRVHRTALVGVGEPGRELEVLVVEPLPGEMPKTEVVIDGFILQLRGIARRTPLTKDIETFLFHPSFPVDVRHNAKIHREELKAWASEQLS
ncbi:MAG: AMP-binding protein [bacterium]|nr:AMP-binding protein [bacterium]